MDEKNERRKFEAWARKHPGAPIDITVTQWGSDWWYTERRTADLWYGWKARAAYGVKACDHPTFSTQSPPKKG
jgi:hypothetical protein